MRRFLRVLPVALLLAAPFSSHAVDTVDAATEEAMGLLTPGALPGSLHGQLVDPLIHTTGESGFMAKLKLIEEAKSGDRIDLAYFIYESDFSSSYFTRKLIEKARAGVKVRILVDYFMAENFRNLYGYLESVENVDVYLFRPPSAAFLTFLKGDLQMAHADHFIRGLTKFDKNLVLQGLASSPLLAPILAKSQGLLAQYMEQRAGGALTAEARAGMAKEMALVLLKEMLNGLKPEFAPRFRAHLIEFTRRMHHKILMVGNAEKVSFISGGRNISDEYHLSLGHPLLAGRSYPFFDAEISGVLLGQDARSLLGTFDSLLSRPTLLMSAKDLGAVSDQDLSKVVAEMDERASRFAFHLSELEEVSRKGAVAVKGPAGIAYSENLPGADLKGKQIVGSLEQIFKRAKREITLISAYAHLSSEMLELARRAAQKGVKINLYTNSFTSTDMNIVNVASYRKFSEWSKALGPAFSLYELQLGAGQGSLHAKTVFVDGEIVGIGSANFDPRSDRLDTNNFVFMDARQSPQLGKTVIGAYVGQIDAAEFSFNLPWAKVDAAYVNAMLEAIKAKKPAILRAVEIQDIVNQL